MHVGKVALAAVVGALAVKVFEKPLERALASLQRSVTPVPPATDDKTGTQGKKS